VFIGVHLWLKMLLTFGCGLDNSFLQLLSAMYKTSVAITRWMAGRWWHTRFSATVTNSEMEIQGLERGKQYWFRIRAGKVGPWSDQATKVANI